MAEVVIHDGNWRQFIDPVIGGERRVRGLRPRNFASHPVGYLPAAPAFAVPTIPQAEWEDRLADLKAGQAQLSDIRATGAFGAMIPSRDQDGKGYCWAHSTTSAVLLARARDGEPYADLSAYAIACILRNYRDQGGWNAESVQFATERGIPSAATWPQRSMSRANDNAQTWEDAKRHRITGWSDLDPNDMVAQLVTCLLLGWPVAADFNWWGHSVCAMDLVSVRPFRIRIWNSWGDEWSEAGAGILEGSRAVPDAATALTVVTASAA